MIMAKEYFTGKKRPINADGVKMLNRDYRDLQWTEREGVSVLECTNGKDTMMSHGSLSSLNLPSLKFQCDRINFDSKKVPLSASMKEIREARKACECAVKTVSLDEFKKKTGWTPGQGEGSRVAILGYK
jgi:hypothetical protein